MTPCCATAAKTACILLSEVGDPKSSLMPAESDGEGETGRGISRGDIGDGVDEGDEGDDGCDIMV